MLQQPLHSVGFRWGSAATIEMEVMSGKGKPFSFDLPDPMFRAEAELEPDEFTLRGVPAMAWRPDGDAFFEPFQLREHTSYWIDISLPASAAASEDLDNPCWPFSHALVSVFKREPRRRWRTDGVRLQIGAELRLLGHAGILDLGTSYTGNLRAEIIPRKLNYAVEYRALLTDLSAKIADLLLRVGSPAGLNFSRDELTEATSSALHFQLRAMFQGGRFDDAIAQILGRLHNVIATRTYVAEAFGAEGSSIDPSNSDFESADFHAGGPLGRFFRGRSPLEFETEELAEKVDTVENRFVKSVLAQLTHLIEEHSHRLVTSGRSSAAAEAGAWLNEVEEALAQPVWRQVGEMVRFPSFSTVLQRRAGYRELYLIALALDAGLKLHWGEVDVLLDGLRGDVRPLSELYEFWCYFTLAEILSRIGEEDVSKATLFELSEGGLELNLKRGQRSRRVFRIGETTAQLYYNRTFRRAPPSRISWEGSYTVRFDPDFSLCVQSATSGIRHWLHFDAKYRIQAAPFVPVDADTKVSGDDAYSTELFRLYSQTDLFKMHTYRDGILGSRGAYILFPGDQEGDAPIFIRKPGAEVMEAGPRIPSVGAFSLRPGMPDQQLQLVEAFISEVITAISGSSEYTEERGLLGSAIETSSPLSGN